MGESSAPKAKAAGGARSRVGHASPPESSRPMKGRNYRLSSTSGEGGQDFGSSASQRLEKKEGMKEACCGLQGSDQEVAYITSTTLRELEYNHIACSWGDKASPNWQMAALVCSPVEVFSCPLVGACLPSVIELVKSHPQNHRDMKINI